MPTVTKTAISTNVLSAEDSASMPTYRMELSSNIQSNNVVGLKCTDGRHLHALGHRKETPQQPAATEKAVRPPATRAFQSLDPAFAQPVTASVEEIRYAHELRRQIVQQYLNRPSPPVSWWCIGVD